MSFRGCEWFGSRTSAKCTFSWDIINIILTRCGGSSRRRWSCARRSPGCSCAQTGPWRCDLQVQNSNPVSHSLLLSVSASQGVKKHKGALIRRCAFGTKEKQTHPAFLQLFILVCKDVLFLSWLGRLDSSPPISHRDLPSDESYFVVKCENKFANSRLEDMEHLALCFACTEKLKTFWFWHRPTATRKVPCQWSSRCFSS